MNWALFWAILFFVGSTLDTIVIMKAIHALQTKCDPVEVHAKEIQGFLNGFDQHHSK